MIDKASQFHISRLEREKGERTKCLARIAAYHFGEKRARLVDIANAKKLVKKCLEYQYHKVDLSKNPSLQVITKLKNEIKFLNDCLNIAVEKDASGEFVDFLELEKLENSIKKELLMQKDISFDDMPRVDSSSGSHFRIKEKLSIFDKVLFGKFSKGYIRAEYRDPKRNDFIPKDSK